MNQIIIFVFGLLVGSFLNVLIARMDELKTVVKTRSHCPKCRKNLEWYDLFPLLSFVLLRGKCRYCKEKISIQYPLVELATGISFVAIYNYVFSLAIPDDWRIASLIFYLIIASILIVLFVYDLLKLLVPDEFVYTGIILTIIFQALAIYFIPEYRLNWLDLLLGALIGAGVPVLLSVPSKGKWMGYGDIGIGALLGLVLGYPLAIVGMFLAFSSGGIVGLILISFGKKKMTSEVPFGPFLTWATLVALIYGDKIIDWYLSLFVVNYY